MTGEALDCRGSAATQNEWNEHERENEDLPVSNAGTPPIVIQHGQDPSNYFVRGRGDCRYSPGDDHADHPWE
ncbi:hypothetical protein GCM10023317_10730 [Actinopolymorpha pittospori]